MRELQLILNGKSAGRDDVRAAVQRLRSEGLTVAVHVTWESGDAARLASAAALVRETTVVAGGGDGTVNEVLNGFLSARSVASLAILPLGTANDFATSAGLPIHDPYAALLIAATATPKACDVGVVNGRIFLNVASGGFGAEVTAATDAGLKSALGGAAYGIEAVLMAAKPYARSVTITTEAERMDCELVMFAVGNGRQAGGGAQLAPDAFINDGLLDLMVVPNHDHARFVQLLRDLARLKTGHVQGFTRVRARRFTLCADAELQINLDGEPLRAKQFDFEVRPRAVLLVLPTHCPLLQPD